MVVEDDFATRRFLANVLKSFADTEIAVNGIEAIQAFEASLANHETRYDVILMDIMMPEMDGQTALKTIREHESALGIAQKDEVKVIMTTSLSDPKTVMDSFYSLGATGYIIKPFNKTGLKNEMRKCGINLS